MDQTKEGVDAALSEAMEAYGDAPPDVKAEQLALLPLPLDEAVKPERRVGQRGRPKGAKNKRTEAWRAWLLSSYRSPLEMLCQTFTMPVGELAKALDCDLLDAFKMQILAAREAGPYLHQKMPVAVDVSSTPAVNLSIFGAADVVETSQPKGEGSILQGKVIEVDEVASEPEENQALRWPRSSDLDSGDLDSQPESGGKPGD